MLSDSEIINSNFKASIIYLEQQSIKMQYFVESWKALEFLLKFYRIQSVITMKAPRHKLWFIAEHMWMSSKCDWWCFFHTNDTQLHVIFLRALPMKKKGKEKFWQPCRCERWWYCECQRRKTPWGVVKKWKIVVIRWDFRWLKGEEESF